MLKRIAKVLGWSVVALASVALVLIAVALVRYKRTFEAPYPEIHASKDPNVIAAGRYIAYGPGHCVVCHSDPAQAEALRNGAEPPLSGGNVFALPFGNAYVPNLTSDPQTGIGRRTDGELARILRYGVRADGRAALPFMECHHMSDQDLQAVISFLRAQPPVRKSIPPHEFNVVGKMILAYVLKPVGPKTEPPKVSPAREATVERGAYLANNVASCAGCHTKRNPLDGSFVAAKFSGGMAMGVDGKPDMMLVTPNLTPDPKTGRIAAWTEEQFVGRFGVGMGVQGTHMPWRQFQSMAPEDVRAIYRYLRTLTPVQNHTGASLQKKTKA